MPPDTEHLATILRTITEHNQTLRDQIWSRLDQAEREHRSAIEKVADGLNQFMLSQTNLNPKLADRDRVEKMSEHLHTMAGMVTNHEARLTKLEQHFERFDRDIAQKLSTLIAGQGELGRRIGEQEPRLLSPADRLRLDRQQRTEEQGAEEARQRRRIWHDSLSKGVVTIGIGILSGGGILGFVLRSFFAFGPHH